MTMTEPAGLLWRTARQGGGWTVALGAAALADAVVAIVFPAVLALAVDAVLAGRGPGGAALLCAALVAVSVTADMVTDLATGAATARATAWLRHTLLHHVLAAGPALRCPPGDVTSRLVGGAADTGIAPAAAVLSAIAVIPPIGALAALILIDWRIALTVCVALPVIAFLLRTFVRDVAGTVHRYLAAQGTMAAKLAGALEGSHTIAAAGTAERESDRVLAGLPELSDHGHAMWRTQGVIAARGLLVGLLLQITVLAVAGYEMGAGRISVGELVAAAQYSGMATGVGGIAAEMMRLGRARGGAVRMAELLGRPAPAYGLAEPPPGPGRLEFAGVAAGGVLHSLDLVVPGGLAVAVVGRSGSGKSLLAALAGRLADPDSGTVLLDGVPLASLNRLVLRREVGYAFARPALFGATMEEAIGFGGTASPRRVRAAAAMACADPFIWRLPEGYGTPPALAPMSGGELQRVGLARAFAHPGRLLILDDATSSLDTATELQISRALLGELGDRTRLVIAHRVTTAARADLVVWLDGGRVRATGRHDELWADPDYRAVFTSDLPETP